jgi:hypothetical protein
MAKGAATAFRGFSKLVVTAMLDKAKHAVFLLLHARAILPRSLTRSRGLEVWQMVVSV